jgi:flavin reductase (DIM6/NTAB) family NADH-FMN oxidoreductase RutF
MIINYQEINNTTKYKLMSTNIAPRPIAWIVTEDDGIVNIAPFSYFTPLSSAPATLIVSIGHKEDKSPKDTLANIRKTKKATICLVDRDNLSDMINSSLPLPKELSEASEFNIETTKIYDNYPSMIKGVKTALFCDFFQELNIGGSTIPIILEIKAQYFEKIDERFYTDFKSVGRIGKDYSIDYIVQKG